MNAGLIVGSVTVVLSVVIAIIFYIYSKNRVAVDKKAMQGDAPAEAEKMIANPAKIIIYQAEKESSSDKDELLIAFNYLIAILDLAHSPHPSTVYIKSEIEKLVVTMKRTRNFVDSVQTLTKKDDTAKQLENKTVVGELKEAKK